MGEAVAIQKSIVESVPNQLFRSSSVLSLTGS